MEYSRSNCFSFQVLYLSGNGAVDVVWVVLLCNHVCVCACVLGIVASAFMECFYYFYYYQFYRLGAGGFHRGQSL